MHELPRIEIFDKVRWFANDFHEWRSHKWKIVGNSYHGWPKIVIHGNQRMNYFTPYTQFYVWIHNSRTAENNHRSLISPLSSMKVFSDLTLWRHNSWSVTSHEREVRALWRHIRRLFLHAQIGAKAIFTSEYPPWISMSHHPVFTA